MRLVSASVLFLTTSASASSSAKVIKSGSIKANSHAGKKIISRATREGSRALEEQEQDISFVSSYSIKFQGCHHITQWNADADNENDVRVATKRLVRFRLCPTDSCSNEDTAGCSSSYGDYIMDMNTFVESYLEGMEEQKEYQCEVYEEICNDNCGEDGGDDDNCEQSCLTGYGMSYCYAEEGGDGDGEAFDPMDYAYCAQWDGANGGGRRKLDENANGGNGDGYYIGPYCADQGGEIHLGLFTDDTCTTFSSLGEEGFYNMAGYELPYSDDSLVSDVCFSCAENDGDDNNDADNVNEMCENIYGLSGKCETNMNIGYPNEAACTYIEGVKIIREDGVIRTSTTKKSKAAAVAIGLFTTIAVLLGAYVYYLRTKLGRAKINLNSSGAAFA